MSEPEATAKQNAGKILVVDDEPALTVAFARKLRREGYECATAGSGEEALKRLESYRPDLVISDVRMPGMSGLDLLKEIKHRDPALKVILTTAYAHIEFVVEALRHGVDDYLVKPFSLSELAASVSRAFEQPVGAPLGEAKGSAGPSGLIAADGVKPSALGLLALAKAFEARDHFTHGHAERVAEQATATGAALGLGPEARRNLWFSAVLHDVGKLRVAEKPSSTSRDRSARMSGRRSGSTPRPEVKSSRAFQIWSPRARGFCTIGKIGTARDTRWGLRARPSASLGGSSMSRTLSTPCSKTGPIARHWIRLALSASSSWAAAPALTRPCLKLSSRSCVDPPEYRDIFVRYLSAFILPEKIR